MRTWIREKRCWLWAAFTFVLITGMLCLFVSRQFYFSPSQYRVLSQLQWDEQADTEPSGERPVIIGHRGSGLDSTDLDAKTKDKLIGNTATAIQAGIAAKADWIEIDIRLSNDGHLVVFHDIEIGTKTTNKDKDKKVVDLSLAQLKGVNVLVDPPEKILTLEEVFTQFHSEEQRWIFDIKATGISTKFLTWLNQSGLSKDQVILFGDYELLLEYKNSKYNSGYTLGYTTLFKNNYRNVLFNPLQIIENCEDLNCDYLVLNMVFAKKSLVDAAKAKGIEVWVYGSDDQTDLENMQRIGISGVIVDHPAQARGYFDN